MRTSRALAIAPLAGALIAVVISSYGCPAPKKQSCTTGQITCDNNDQCNEDGCTNGCCVPLDAGLDAGPGDAGLPDGGCDCVIPDAGPAHLQCITDQDCAGNAVRPYCDTVTNTCVNCIQSWQCPSVNDTCQANVCATAQTCSTNTDCTASGTPYCNEAWDTCGECEVDLDCPVSQTCVQGLCESLAMCTSNAQCNTEYGDTCQASINGSATEYLFFCGSAEGATVQGGEPCASDNDCLSGFCNPDNTSHDNLGWCLNACQTDSDCGPDAWCPPDGVVPRVMTGPDGVFGTGDDVYDTVHVCMPKRCSNNADCADFGLDGGTGDWICGLSPGTTTSETVTGATTSWVQSCLPIFGSPGQLPVAGPCTEDHQCASYLCLNGRCFDPCTTSADCTDDGGTCAPLGPDAGYVDESGNPISSCTQ